MKLLTKVFGAWKQVRRVFVKQSGIWKPVKSAWIKQAGAWKQFYAAFTQVAIPTVLWTPGNGGADAARVEVPAGVDVPDNGGFLFRLHQGIIYWGPDMDWVEGWSYSLLYRTGTNPTWDGPLKVTNVTTGVSLTLPKLNALQWTLILDSPQSGDHNYPDPNVNWIRAGATDTFRIERA